MKHIPIFILLLLVCLKNSYSKEIIHHYTVSISKDLKTLSVTAQFGDIDFYYLYSGSENTGHFTHNMQFTSDKSMKFTKNGNEIELNHSLANQTLYYEFDITSAAGKGRWAEARTIGDDIILPPDLWLWRPYSLEENEHIEVQFEMPDNINFSVPWKLVAKNHYRIEPTPVDWPSAAVFGSFPVDTIFSQGCKVSVAFLDGDYQTTQSALLSWIKGAVSSVCKVYGTFPVHNFQVILVPVRKGTEPVPFGMVVRGGGISITFYIDPSRPLQEFIDDWTATHELSHCLLPMINRDDAWLSEGLATYYQYILMGRDGRFTEQQTWQRIYNGFQKGIRDFRGKSLRETSENMYETKSFRNVYWSGAAILLKVDVALRQASDNLKSLDWVLKKVQQNLLPQNTNWTGLEMIQMMDKLGQTSVFTDIYNKDINSKVFPVDDAYWSSLGVDVINGDVVLNDNAPYSRVRQWLLSQNQ